jgi:hypothetical protein
MLGSLGMRIKTYFPFKSAPMIFVPEFRNKKRQVQDLPIIKKLFHF